MFAWPTWLSVVSIHSTKVVVDVDPKTKLTLLIWLFMMVVYKHGLLKFIVAGNESNDPKGPEARIK